MMLQCWAVLKHFVFRAYLLKVLVRESSNFTHNTSRWSSCAFWVILTLTYFWFRTMTYLDVLTHTSFPEQISKSTESITVILHIHVL